MTAHQEVRTRLVLNFPGFEKTDSEAQLGRLLYSANNSGEAWGFTVEQGPIATDEGTHFSQVEHVSRGNGWTVDTRVVQFRWNDIVHVYENAPFPGGFLRDLGKFVKFFADGTVGKYRRASLRYWGFTIYPFLLAIIFALLAGAVLWFVLGWLGLSGIIFAIALIVLIALAVLLLSRWPGERLYVPMTIADWGFARDMVERANPEIEARFAQFAEATREVVAASDHDEIIIVGHSFGAVWAVEALARAIRLEPARADGKRIVFLALGSSIAKIALAPGAGWLRDSVALVARQPSLFWHEVQTKDDFIAFYKADPFTILGVEPPAHHTIERIRFSKGIAKKRYREIRRSMYRTHRQYILHYDKRVGFDTMLKLFGPFAAKTIAARKDAAGLLDRQGRISSQAATPAD